MSSKKNIVKSESVNICGRSYEMRKSIFCSNYSPVIVSDNMTGKMDGIPCISTSCLLNTICQSRRNDPKSICSHCFAAATASRYRALSNNLESNYHLLTNSVLGLDLLPRFRNVVIVRIEAFGDIQNETQAINYINICKVNPRVRFGWWTKNYAILQRALEKCGKPDNLSLVVSSPYTNETVQADDLPGVDHVFTVYDHATIAAENIEINCGARDCSSCQRCYFTGSDRFVKEALK